MPPFPKQTRYTRDGRLLASKVDYMALRDEMARRQKRICPLCLLPMMEPTFDHEVPRGLGGSRQDDRILNADGTWRNAAVHRVCNYKKASKRYHWKDGVYQPCIS